MTYWAETEHLGLDDEGRLWLKAEGTGWEGDRGLGPIERAKLPAVWGLDPARLEYERDWLYEEWHDAPDPAELRAEARATYYGGLLR